ncbi:MAG TPA: hypothetical protein VFB96_15615 [Pirellulaceae bacterium]|jgi:hypothetical protein|nr:hypothetical protein [Pirellulaceae bacterium]
MKAALMDSREDGSTGAVTEDVVRYIDPTEFRSLMVSHRRMERANDFRAGYRALRDLDSGELFLVDERRLIESKR